MTYVFIWSQKEPDNREKQETGDTTETLELWRRRLWERKLTAYVDESTHVGIQHVTSIDTY